MNDKTEKTDKTDLLLKGVVIFYWVLFAAGLALTAVGFIVGDDLLPMGFIGLVLPGVFNLFNVWGKIWKNHDSSKNPIIRIVLTVWLTFMWCLLGLPLGLYNAIKYTKGYIESK